jgi:quercetin dioxygenase-like cupin family protein
MASRLTKHSGRGRITRRGLLAKFKDEGLLAYEWSSPPGEYFDWHTHPFRDVIRCLSGSIAFHLRDDGDVVLAPGDRFEMDPHTVHAATVGEAGVTCLESQT